MLKSKTTVTTVPWETTPGHLDSRYQWFQIIQMLHSVPDALEKVAHGFLNSATYDLNYTNPIIRKFDKLAETKTCCLRISESLCYRVRHFRWCTFTVLFNSSIRPSQQSTGDCGHARAPPPSLGLDHAIYLRSPYCLVVCEHCPASPCLSSLHRGSSSSSTFPLPCVEVLPLGNGQMS